MPNSFDVDPRGPSHRLLLVEGVCFIAIAAIIAGLMGAKSKGALDQLVRVDVELVDIGDGLPQRSDVKFRGVLVGAVSEIIPSQFGGPNHVHVALKPGYASGIPNTVTARVVPSNIFAVSSVQFVDNGKGSGPLRSGSVVREDKSLPTVLFQNVLARLRQLLAAVARKPDENSIGLMATLGEATHGRGQQLTDTGHDLNDILTQLNTVVGVDDTGPSTLSALTAAADGLRSASPELFDALDSSIAPMQTFAEKRVQLDDFLSGGLGTSGMLGDAFDHQTDRLITISTELTPALGVIADHANEFHDVSTRLQRLADKAYEEAWDPDTNLPRVKAAVAFTPTRTYVRADCPRYGDLAGPSCLTAPEVPTAPDLLPSLGSMGFPPTPGVAENRPNVTPPRHSMPDDPQGPPGPPPGGPQLPDESPAPEDPAPAGIQPQSNIRGNVGPVGSRQEMDQLGRIVGGRPSVALDLLLGPLSRGTTVHITPDPGGDR
ncbi:MlaD family protein [Mycobacterium sp. pUA109]|uniref:MlaD family protein n=1 Tax=Mycobacterium sp. pUA109 TaxID=3238982 RepID=UPI00351B60C2